MTGPGLPVFKRKSSKHTLTKKVVSGPQTATGQKTWIHSSHTPIASFYSS